MGLNGALPKHKALETQKGSVSDEVVADDSWGGGVRYRFGDFSY